MLNFLPGCGVFAIAGLIAAAAPLVIHLLNRRRFQVKEWAAMDFLREAMRRNRRLMRLRDLLLLVLRSVALALFGLALARPFFSSKSAEHAPNQPVHAVLLVDNSLSMGYQKADGSVLLDEAKARAGDFVKELPEGSIISVIPLCGAPKGFSRDAYRTAADARDALEQIRVMDRSCTAAQALDWAIEACGRHHEEMPAERVVYLGDQQRINWPSGSLAEQIKKLPELQIVSIAPETVENSWVADFRMQDGIADLDTPTIFTAVIRHEGPSPRHGVEVKLFIYDQEVDSKGVDLKPGQTLEVTFAHRFNVPVEEGRPTYVPARVSIPHDRQRADDERFLMVPVMAAVPVVFVDQYGSDENPQKNRFGETRHLRRLMAAESDKRQLVRIEHVRVNQIDRKLLENTRMVVMAGVGAPTEEAVKLLREFVRQGGQLLIAAGGEFDPAAWTSTAWLDGAGILPAPLADKPLGQTPEEAKGELQWFFLSFPSMAPGYFHLADTKLEVLKALYRLPVFFKAVAADMSDATIQKVRKADLQQIEKEREPGATRPNWLLWKPQQRPGTLIPAPELAERWRPTVLASYDNKEQAPFLIRRTLGEGQILFVSTGVYSSWNTLPRTNAVLMFSRILRSMLEATLPQRNLTTDDTLVVPITDRHALYQLIHPDGSKESLTVDALGSDLFSVTVLGQPARGIYRVTGSRIEATSAGDTGGDRIMETAFAVNGPAQESEPAVLDEAALKERLGDAGFRWIGRGETIRVEGVNVSGRDLWKVLLVLVLGCLLVEMAVLAWPMLARRGAS